LKHILHYKERFEISISWFEIQSTLLLYQHNQPVKDFASIRFPDFEIRLMVCWIAFLYGMCDKEHAV